MFYNNNNLGFSIRYVYKSKRGTQTTFNSGRKITALSFRLSGYSIFEFQNKRMKAATGSLTYIPPDVDYTLHGCKDELIIIHLNAFGQNEDTIQIINTQNSVLYADLFNQIYMIWESKCEGYANLCLSLLYRLFSELEKKELRFHSNGYALIRNSVIHMRSNFQDPNLTISALAAKSGISEVYFRKLFKEEYGISPGKELLRMRIEFAKTMLDSELFSIAQIAETAGFRDQRYFSVAFKKATGITPSDYRNSKYH